jgi:tetratricopeptide (TPR) repeat protein
LATLAEAWSEANIVLVLIREGSLEEAAETMAKSENLLYGAPESPFSVFASPTYSIARGEIFLAEGRYEEAVAAIRDSMRLSVPKLSREAELMTHNFPLDGDVAARAFLAMGEMEKAADEYRRLIEYDPESSNRRLRYPLYHYRLAKVYEDMGNREEAAEEYRTFLEYWKNADPDRPEYIDARRRLDALQKS